jgi:hypothetical protein
MLKVDKLANVQFFKRYNKLTRSNNGPIASVVDPSGIENYVLVESINAASRVLSTNTSGVTCGDEDIQPGHNTYSYSPSTPPMQDISIYGYYPILVSSGNSYNDSDCNALYPNYKSTTYAATLNTESRFSVYPTLLSQGDNSIHLRLYNKNVTELFTTLYSIDGREVSHAVYSLKTGENEFIWDAGIKAPGTYILKVWSADKQISKTIQLSKL